MPTEREERLEEILSNFLRPLRDIPFEVLIRGLFDRRVEPFDKTPAGNAELLDVLRSAMHEVCLHVQADPIERNRPNEVGNDMQDPAIEQLRRVGLDAIRPKTGKGKGQSMGYPDIEIVSVRFGSGYCFFWRLNLRIRIWTLPIKSHARDVATVASKSGASRRLRLSHASVLSTTQRRGNAWNLPRARPTASIRHPPLPSRAALSFGPAQAPSAKMWRSHGNRWRIEASKAGAPSRS